MVSFREIRKSYGTTTVLSGLNLDIRESERVSIIGPSGSGKTTILRLLMTLQPPDSGMIFVDGECLTHCLHKGDVRPADERHLRRIRPKIGMVFQHFNLFPHMTALQNVAMGPQRVLGLDRHVAESRARSLLEKVGLTSRIDAFPGQMSGGQQQRVGIARAMAMEPRIMLFDEVTSALDPELVNEVLAVLRDLADNTDVTMLLVTHEMRFARQVSDRVVMVDAGAVVEEGPPEQLFTDPTELRTKKFLNSIIDR
jgi:polar amino acid transport system ATP-binding protein